jgi:hypothetical protein
MTRQISQATEYFTKARPHYSHLNITPANDEEFLKYLGCSKSLKKMWRSFGIRKVYHRIIELLDENGALKKALEEQKEGCKRLEEQLKEILKK